MKFHVSADAGLRCAGSRFAFSPSPRSLTRWNGGFPDVIHSVDELRQRPESTIFSFAASCPPDDVSRCCQQPCGCVEIARNRSADVKLLPRDQITVFDLSPDLTVWIHLWLDECPAVYSANTQPGGALQRKLKSARRIPA